MSKRKTKFLAVLLSLALAFSLSGVIVFAVNDGSDDTAETPVAELAVEPEAEETVSEEGTPEDNTNPTDIDGEGTSKMLDVDDVEIDYEASIGEKTYDTLKAAIQAANETTTGDPVTVTLAKDITADCSDNNYATITAQGLTVDLNQNTITVKGTNNEKYLFYVDSGGAFTLKDGTIEGAYEDESEETVNSTVTAIDSHAESDSIVVDSVTIQHFGAATNGVIYAEAGDLTVKNCSILNNQTHGIQAKGCNNITITDCMISGNTTSGYGGGIYIWNEHSDICIEHNTISENQASYGGGIYISEAEDGSSTGEFKVVENVITENQAIGNGPNSGDGGGIYFIASSTTASEGAGDFDLSGNTITHNTANGYGGGVELTVNVEGREIVIKSGYIAYNSAYWGGGIDSSYKFCQSTMHLYNAIITDNVAEFRGGGIWACPTSETTMNVTFGAAIYGNKATGEKSLTEKGGSGDSIRFEGKDTDATSATNANGYAHVSERALGGTLMDWYADDWEGNRYKIGASTVDVTSERYTGYVDSFGLHGELSEKGIALAEEDALLYIVHNTSQTVGGGIATNTAIDFGTDDEYTLLTVTANKVWLDENGIEMPAEQTADYSVEITLVRVDVYRNKEIEEETVTLNAENNWTWDFEDLPTAYMTADYNDSTGEYTYTEHSYTYTVKEKNATTDGNFEVKVESSEVTKNEETGNSEQTITIYNTFVVEPKLSKEIKEDDYKRKDQDIEHDDENGHFEENIKGDGWGTWDDADNNQEITFHLTLTDIKGAVNLTVHDYLEEGLAFEDNEVEVVLYDSAANSAASRTLTAESDYTMNETKCSDPSGCAMAGCTFEIQFKDNVFKDLGDDAYIVITYKALTETHEEDYDDYVDEILNQSYMTYGISAFRSSIVTTATDLFGFGIYKYADVNGTETALAGAEFVLERDGVYATFTTETDKETGAVYYMVYLWVDDVDSAGTLISDKDGMIRIEGLDDDTYTLTETAAPSGYQKLKSSVQVTIDENGDITFRGTEASLREGTTHEISIRNTTEETTSTSESVQIVGTKTWVGDDDNEDSRPESINILLYADGDLIRARTVRASDSWKYSFTGLDKYGSDGHEIVYTIKEVQVPGYSTEYDGYDITNKYIAEEDDLIEIPVTKVWDDGDDADGIRPGFVSVELYLNGDPTGLILILDDDNGWSGSFTDLTEETDGVKNIWTVVETAVEGYESSVSGNEESGFVITNSYTPDETDENEEPFEFPDEPDEPDEPGKTGELDEPKTPDEQRGPDLPGGGKDDQDITVNEVESEKATLPQTGDKVNLRLWISLILTAGVIAVGLGIYEVAFSYISEKKRREW